jgi:hypothetical protein
MQSSKLAAFVSQRHLLICLLAASTSLPLFGNAVTITNVSGVARSNTPYTISRVFAQGEIAQFAQARVSGSPIATQCDVKTRWPDGSVQHALVSFLVNLPASGAVTVDFINTATGNNAAGMTKSEMLAAAWGAQIEATNGATTLIANARTILNDWNGSDSRVTYWLKGPICTQVILEDRSTAMAYDIGFDANKSMHPIFVVTFYPGSSAGVKVEMILENAWSTKVQDQTYSLALKIGNPLGSAVYTKSSFTHFGRTRWRKVFWNGQAPPRVKLDYNLAYLAHSRAIPNYDTTKVPSSSALQGEYNNFMAGDQGDINGAAFWLKYMPQTGGREDIGLMPGWYSRYLHSFDPNAYDVMLGNAAVSGHVPVHYRESRTSLNYDLAGSVNAFGKTLSVNAHPTSWGAPFQAAGTLGSTGWTVDLAHQPSFVYVPYLITGDWYFLEELYNWAASIVVSTDPANVAWGRNGNWGIVSWSMQTRGIAWGLRTLGHAAFMAPDGTPEKAYFREKLDNNIAVREGNLNITDGAFYNPAAGSKWHWGRNTFSYGLAASPLGHPNYPDAYATKERMMTSGSFAVQYVDGPWLYGYLMIVYGHLQELGFPTQKLVASLAKYFINGAVNPSYNPWLLATYRTPVTRASTGQYFQSWSDAKSAYDPVYQALTSWPPDEAASGSGESNVNHGYPHIVKAAMSFVAGLSDGSYTGQAAWNWINANVGYQSGTNSNPRWSILPRGSGGGSPPPTVSRCDVNSDGSTNVLDIQLTINQALQPATCTTGDVDRNGTCNVIDVQIVVNTTLGSACP